MEQAAWTVTSNQTCTSEYGKIEPLGEIDGLSPPTIEDNTRE